LFLVQNVFNLFGVVMKQQGFTLMELLIGIVIVGILMAIALPAYQDYTYRAKVTEVVMASANCKLEVAEFVQGGGVLAAGGGANTFSCDKTNSSKYVASITTTSDGVITTTARGTSNTDIDGKSIVLVPTVVAGSITEWNCGPSATNGITIKYLPSSCRPVAVKIADVTPKTP
jgi:type IV pilus assembly protein PilA